MSRFTIYVAALREALVARQIPVEGGPMDGVLIITNRDIIEAFEKTPIPPPDEHSAELVEPAEVALWAECHHCHENVPTMVRLESYSKARAHGTIVGHIAIGNPVTHTCGQLRMKMATEVPGQQEADWTIVDITGIEQHTCRCEQAPLCIPHGWAGDRTAPEEQQDWNICVEHEHVAAGDTMHIEVDSTSADVEPDAGTEPTEFVGADDPVVHVIEVCPFPGCILTTEHPGDHEVETPDGFLAVPGDGLDVVRDALSGEDDALLPGEGTDAPPDVEPPTTGRKRRK